MFWWTLAVVVGFLLLWLMKQEENPLDRLPGPPRLPIVGNVFTFLRMKSPDELFNLIRSYIHEYGDRFVVKVLHRRILHISHPDDVELVLSHSRNINKSMPYHFLQPWLGTGLLLSTGSKWSKRRKILTPTFHFNILQGFAKVFDENSRRLVVRLRETSGEVDVLTIMSDFTLHTICETAMGTQLDIDKSSAAVEYKKSIKVIGHLLFRRLLRVWHHNDFIFKMSAIGKEFERNRVIVQNFADNVIIEKKKRRKGRVVDNHDVIEDEDLGIKKRVAMLDLLLEAESKGEIDLEGIREEVNTFMFEGHDTTAMALSFCLILLADHQEVQDRIYEERQLLMASGASSTVDFAGLKYLEAVIKESLRLYPSVPFIAREIVEDFNMGDILVKRGSEVAIHIFDVHRRPDFFEDPQEFRPDRFLANQHSHPFAFVPFSAGPRNCIGQRFAMQKMKYALSEICGNFILKRSSKEQPTLIADMILRSAGPIHVAFIPR